MESVCGDGMCVCVCVCVVMPCVCGGDDVRVVGCVGGRAAVAGAHACVCCLLGVLWRVRRCAPVISQEAVGHLPWAP